MSRQRHHKLDQRRRCHGRKCHSAGREHAANMPQACCLAGGARGLPRAAWLLGPRHQCPSPPRRFPAASFKAAGWSSSTADTLDPAKASLSTDYVRCCSLYNRLTFLDRRMASLQMELADSIESSDAKIWTVKLRKSGVTFHDGKSLTSADVVYSLKRHLDEAIGSKVTAIAEQMDQIQGSRPADRRDHARSIRMPTCPTILAHAPLHDRGRMAPPTSPRAIGTGAFVLANVSNRACGRSISRERKLLEIRRAPTSTRFEYHRHQRRHAPA